MKKRWINNKTGVLAITLGISLVILALAILFGNTTVSRQLLNILLLIGLCLGCSFLLLTSYFRKSLGRAMRVSPTRESLTSPAEETEVVRPRSPSAKPRRSIILRSSLPDA